MKHGKNDGSPVPLGLYGRIMMAMAVTALVGCPPASSPTLQGPPMPKDVIFIPPPPQMPRVQFLCNLRGSKDFATAPQRGLAEFVVGGDALEPKHETVGKPFGVVAIGSKVFVTDTKGARICVFDMKRKQFWTFGRKGKGTLGKPINIRADAAGRLCVTDMMRNQIVVFDQDGKYITEFGKPGDFSPADVVDIADERFVLDISAHSIDVYDLKSHQFKRSLGKRGRGLGEFNFPTNMVADTKGDIYVTDLMNIRIQKINKDTGKAMMVFGRPGRTPGHFSRPKGIAVDRDGIIYVVDAMLHIVQLFDQEGNALMHIGGVGVGEGQLYLPTQVTISYDSVEAFRDYISPDFEARYLIFVTSQLGPNKVSVFAFGKGPPATDAGQPTTRPATQPTTQPE